YHGFFNFNSLDNKTHIQGNYQNNLKHGAWRYTLYDSTWYYYSLNTIVRLQGRYNNGKLIGKWLLQRTETYPKVSRYSQLESAGITHLFREGKIDFNLPIVHSIKSIANFNNNGFHGDFEYTA